MIPVSPPMTGEAGPTGTWRSCRPVIDPNVCFASRTPPRSCYLCWLYCPEASVTINSPPQIDYQYCKGCGICATECPADAVVMKPEVSEEQA
jgi:pyruvate ferredoxin oxidoreductase delta subunit